MPFDPGSASTGDEAVGEFDRTSADIPIWGWLTGSSARRDAARNNAAQQFQQGSWRKLMQEAPTANQLAVNYGQLGTTDEYGNLIGGPSQVTAQGAGDEASTMAALRNLSSGQLSPADRQAMQTQAAMVGQQMGSANQAALQQQQARGQGGGGGALAAQLGGSQAAALANAGNNAQIQMGAQQRGMQALQGMASLGGQMNQEQLARQNALDQYNQQQLGWRRDRSAANVGLEGKSNESRANAYQQQYQNAEHGVAGLTNQYQQGQSNRRADGTRQDQQNQAGVGLIAGLLSDIGL